MKKTKNQYSIKINKVYTKSGDKGDTQLIGGERVPKNDLRVEAYGVIDELNSVIGLCRALLIKENNNCFNKLVQVIIKVQHDLFNLGTVLALSNRKEVDNYPQLSVNSIQLLEEEIDAKNHDLSVLDSFVLPGSSVLSSHFHVARNVCRRAERNVVALGLGSEIESKELIYLNRLSDALFVWSRWIDKVLKNNENLWSPNI